MSHIPDDKSALKGYCKPEGGRGRDEHGDHINLSAPNVAPVLCPSHEKTCSDNSKNKKISRLPPRRLAFCGGGIRCVAHVGVLKALMDANILSCVKEMVGISAGSLFALLFVIGYTIEQIERLSLEFDFTRLGNIDPEDILMFHMNFGLNSGDEIDKLIASILRQKGLSPDITFAELSKKVSMGFRCYATELQTSQIKELSVNKTPDMQVRVAVRASMSLPIMYAPVKEKGDSLLVDGGLLHNLPLVFLTEEEVEESWGVLFIPSEKSVKPMDGIFELFTYLYDGLIIMRNKPCLKKFKERLITIQTEEVSALNFEESKEMRMKIIEAARSATEKFIYTDSPLKKRRFSSA